LNSCFALERLGGSVGFNLEYLTVIARSEAAMKTILLGLTALLSAIWIPDACAQDVWAYQVVGPHNVSITEFRPPVDLTYPPPGVSSVIVDANSRAIPQGTPLTAQEEARRMASGQLIITLMPQAEADRFLSRDLQ
jgi:hypothetical protein